MKLTKEQIEQEVASIFSSEKSSWENSHVFVTEQVAFDIRNLIRKLRKNYWGVFDQPIDPTTGRKKIWVPLTESTCEAIVKNIDLDTKDANLRAKKPSKIGYTSILRNKMNNFLEEINFGEKLDRLERILTIDGTAIWKITEEYNQKEKEKQLCIREVDRLNFYIDPNAECIQNTTVIERILMTPNEFKSLKGLTNTEGVTGDTKLHPTDDNLRGTSIGKGGNPYIEVYERWGLLEKKYITGNSDDTDLVETRAVASREGSNYRVHLIEINKNEYKPYEEAWFRKVSGRWDGKGPSESLLYLQEWLNTIVNIRVNRSYVSQLGIWKVRSGSGITPESISRLPANGAIKVTQMSDIEQIQMQDASPSSYKDEEVIFSWSQRVSQTFDVATGENLPSSTPATNAAIQSNSAQSSFVMIKEQVGLFLQRVFSRHIIPYVAKQLTQGEILRLTDNPEEIKKMDELLVNELLYSKISEMNAKNIYVLPQQIESEKQRMYEILRRMGKDRYMEILNKIDPSDYDIKFFVTNEEIDKSVLSSNLINILSIAPEYREEVLQEIFDIMGLDSNRLKPKEQMDIAAQPSTEQMLQPQSMAQLVTKANTLQGATV